MMTAQTRAQDLQVSLLARNGLQGKAVRVAGVRLPDRKQNARLVAARGLPAIVAASVTTAPLALTRTAERKSQLTSDEAALLEAIADVKGRGREATEEQKEAILSAATALESSSRGVSDPVSSPLVEGTWELLFTTRPGSASIIQRSFVGVDAFRVFQAIDLSSSDPRVSNIVEFGTVATGRLKVEAVASANPPKRIDFRFDRAAFEFSFLPFPLPYPVPFRLLGDKAKGWLDTTYLAASGQLRISRGNKGTVFILRRFVTVKERLLDAVRTREGVEEAIEAICEINPTASPAKSPTLSGTWRLVWTSQSSDASRLQQLSVGVSNNFQSVSVEDGRLENIVKILPFLVLRAGARADAISPTRTDVEIDSAALEVGPISIPLPVRGTGFIDQLYLDDNLRVSRGNKGSLFVHLREASTQL